MCKENGGSFQTPKTTLLVQKCFESYKNMRDRSKNICNYYKLTYHWAGDCKTKKIDVS
jgi:hypothetical protein